MTGVSNSSTKPENEDIPDYEQCGCEIGCGRFRTKRLVVKFLNCFNNAKGALFFLSIGVFCQGLIVNGFVSIAISTLEKRFHLRSWETGLIAGCYDIGVCLALPIVTYTGGRGHRPLWLGWGVFIMGLGSIVFSLPHFLAPKYQISDFEICSNSSLNNCGESSLRAYRGFFILGQILHGIGASPLFTLSITYLDANVKQTSSSVYNGVFFAFSIIGPGVGYLIGGRILTLFTNLNESVDIDVLSPLWVGNWWLGFLIAGSFTILISMPIIMYPKQLPGSDKLRLDRESEVHKGSDNADTGENFGRSIKDLPRCLLTLLKNPTLVFLSISGAMDSGLAISLATFGPKYIEAMFSLSASAAALYFGVATILSASTAHIIGGIIVSRFKMKVTKMIKLCVLCSTIAFGLLFSFLIRCENQDFAGVNVPYHGDTTIKECSTTCECSVALFNPVCGKDDITYVSYCDAGCSSSEDNTFVNCTRVLADSQISSLFNATAVAGKCAFNTTCPPIALLLVVAGLAVFFTFLKAQPAIQASLRCVPFYQRSFAIGIQWFFIRILGTIPIPIILGKVLDLSCKVWGEECGECGSCKLYANESMASYITALVTTAKGVSIVLLIIALKTYKPHSESKKTNITQNNVSEENHIPIQNGGNQYDNKAFESS